VDVQGAIEFAANPVGKILANLLDLPGPRQIERMLKPAAFSVANPGTPSHAPPSKRQKINLNTPPSFNRQSNPGSYGRGRGGYSRGRGNGVEEGIPTYIVGIMRPPRRLHFNTSLQHRGRIASLFFRVPAALTLEQRLFPNRQGLVHRYAYKK